jgi:hypothetical protein
MSTVSHCRCGPTSNSPDHAIVMHAARYTPVDITPRTHVAHGKDLWQSRRVVGPASDGQNLLCDNVSGVPVDAGDDVRVAIDGDRDRGVSESFAEQHGMGSES